MTAKLGTVALIVAAGQGTRAGTDRPKQYVTVRGKPMLAHSVTRMTRHERLDRIWVVHGPDQHDMARAAVGDCPHVAFVEGGATRRDSVRSGLRSIQQAGGADRILVHDAARPFVSAGVVDRLLDALGEARAAIPVLPVVDTVTRRDGPVAGDLADRASLWRVQTPQAFDFATLVAAHERWDPTQTATDDAQMVRRAGHEVRLVEGDEALNKYTYPGDFADTAASLTRVGTGFDVHRLVKGGGVTLGGIEIAHDRRLAGHSDADVALHALTDALLGAVAKGDIGDHFPPSDPQWKGASSDRFLAHAVALLHDDGGVVNNADVTIICERPRIGPHRAEIRANVARLLKVGIERVSVKATTTERLGFTGREEGVAAQAIVSVTVPAR